MQLNKVYEQDYNLATIMNFFYATLMTDIFLNSCGVMFGLWALARHQVKAYKNFTTIYGLCIFTRVILAYVNK